MTWKMNPSLTALHAARKFNDLIARYAEKEGRECLHIYIYMCVLLGDQ